MLSSIRKFSSSFFAKIFLFIIAIPFVFWGMGPLFTGGNLNTIVKIGNEKVSTQEFINFVKYNAPEDEILDKNLIDKMLSNFIGEKLITLEIANLDIKLSDISLSKIIKNEKIFKRENKFSRTEYEKFLIKNNLSAVTLENNISRQKEKEQLLNFIGGGIVPSKFLVNLAYDKINQKRNIQIINLNDVFKKKLNFSENQIETYFNQNKNAYKNIYRSIKFIKLNPLNLTGGNEFSDAFFQKIDKIDDLIVEGRKINYILNEFNLESANSVTFSKLNMNKDSEKTNEFPIELINNVFDIDESEPTVLIEYKDQYFIVEVTKTENIQRKITDESVKKEILLSLERKTKRKLISEIISKINKNNFNKVDFDKLSYDEKVIIKKVKLENLNDDKVLKQQLIKQIYAFSEKKIIVVADITLTENFLIYIDKIENVSIDQNSKDYKKYLNMSEIGTANSLYNTYDFYLKNKYKININYKALDSVKNNI